MPIGDVFSLNVDQTWNGQNCTNVHHFLQTSVDGTGTWQTALLAVWNAQFRPELLASMVTAVFVDQVRMRRVSVPQTQQTITTIADNGDQLAVGLPTHCATLLRQRAIPTGRKGTGSVKLCGTPLAGVQNGRLTVAQAALVQAYGDKFETSHLDAASGYEFHAGVLSQADGVLRTIEKCRVTPRVVTVHSRQIGVGN